MKKISFSILLIGTIILIELNPQQVVSQNQRVRFVQPVLSKPPVNRGAPTDKRAAGTRGECPAVSTAPTGLIPTVALNKSQFVIGNSATEYPTFWYYIPYSAEKIHFVKFALVDEKENLLTKEPIPINISGIPGIISFTLPKTEQPLKPGQSYHSLFIN